MIEDLDRPDVVHQPREDRAGRRPVVVRQAEPLEPVVEPVPQVADHPLADPADDGPLATAATAWAAKTASSPAT